VVAARTLYGGAPVAPSPPSPTWAWPRWLERQLDPTSPAFVPGADAWSNRTGRRWTVLGTPTGGAAVAVDDRGLVWPLGAAWALDWWVGAEDRWRFPAREAAVRQSLVDGEPVVETVLRVPGGDARSRVHVAAGEAGQARVVLEVEADTAAPFALAWAIVPATPAGLGAVRSVSVEGSTVTVDGQAVLWLPTRPGRLALAGEGGWAGPDAAHAVVSGRAVEPGTAPGSVTSEEGAVTAAVVLPVAHRTALRAQLVPPAPVSRRRRRPPSLAAPPDPPRSEAVASGWRSLVERTARLVLPEGPLASAMELQRRHLAVAAATLGEPGPGPARTLVAAGQAGVATSAVEVLDRWWAAGSAADRELVAAGASLWTLESLVALGAVELAERWLPRVAERAERLARAAGHAPETAAWGRAGLRAAAALLAAGGEPAAAGRVAGWLPAAPLPAPPALRGTDGRVTGAPAAALALLDALGPLGLTGDEEALVTALQASLADDLVAVGEPVLGMSPAATLALAARCLGPGPRAAERAEQLVGAALRAMSPTGAWPEALLPATGQGATGSGHDPVAAAALWELGRGLLVADRPGSASLALVPCLPAGWWGAPLEVHGLPTRVGPVSFALRWHGHRPALLWEVSSAVGPVSVTSPGLDPGWSSPQPTGEALFDLEPGAGEGTAFS
jgi:hypothetical protein